MNDIITMMEQFAHILFLGCVSLIEIAVSGSLFYFIVLGAIFALKEIKKYWVGEKQWT